MENQPQQPQSSSPKSGETFWKVSTIVVMVVLAVFAFKVSSDINKIGSGAGDNTITGNAIAGNAPSPRAPAPTPTAPTVDMAKLVDDDSVKGDPDAPITIVEFSDYECPFCGRFYSQTLGQIDEEYIKTGKVKLVFRDFPLSFHPQAQKAAEAAECAGEQGKYYDMHDKLFEDGVQGGTTSFKQYAKDISLNTAKFDTCLDSGSMAKEVQKDFTDGQAAGIQGTPGFLVNGVPISGAQPFSAFQQIIEAQLAAN